MFIFDQNVHFWPKCSFLTKMFIFGKIFTFDQTVHFDQNIQFSPKSSFFTKIFCLVLTKNPILAIWLIRNFTFNPILATSLFWLTYSTQDHNLYRIRIFRSCGNIWKTQTLTGKTSQMFIFGRIFIFWQIFHFWQNFSFLTKIFIFDKNFHFWQKFSFLTKNFIFDKIFNFCQTVHFHQNVQFWPNFSFLTKILIFD